MINGGNWSSSIEIVDCAIRDENAVGIEFERKIPRCTHLFEFHALVFNPDNEENEDSVN